jgi:cystathionine beta-lyase
LKDSFDFDRVIKREGTASLKYDGRQDMFGDSDVIPLWVADMDFASPPAVTAALIERANHPINGYTIFPESLYAALIDWFKRRHGWIIEREWIVMSPGVVPSLHAAVMAFTSAQDSVIIQPPVYFPFFSAVTDAGRNLLLNPLRLEKGQYRIDFEHLEQCAADARMIILCSPHNPVGRVWRKDELTRLLEIAAKYDLIIFSDEIHADLVYPEAKHHILEPLSANRKNIITAVAPSKTFNTPGLNLSALIIPDASQRSAITKVFDGLHVSAANPFSIVAFEAAYQNGDVWLDTLLCYLKETRDFVVTYLNNHLPNIHVSAPEGTYLLWLDCRDLGMNDAQLRQFFIQHARVGLSPGIIFGEAGSGFMRMNIAAPRSVITTALNLISQAIKSLEI